MFSAANGRAHGQNPNGRAQFEIHRLGRQSAPAGPGATIFTCHPVSFARSLQQRSEAEDLFPAGVFRPGGEIDRIHFRPAVLRRRRRPADGCDRRRVARHRAAHRVLHRHGAGASVVGAAQDVRRDDVHRPSRRRLDDPRAGSGARRADGRRTRRIGNSGAARLDARHRADRCAQHARHRSRSRSW